MGTIHPVNAISFSRSTHANGNGTHSLLKVSPPEDPDTRLILDKMASFVAEGGAELERKAKEDYKNNPVFFVSPSDF